MSDRRSRILAIVLAAAMLLSVAAAGGAPLALADDEPPVIPAAYYGDLEINGEPVPAGVEVVALIDGEERGSLVTEQEGQYGGPAIGDAKLEVQGSAEDEGKEVTFLVEGVEFEPNEPVTFESEDHREVNLTGDGFPDFQVAVDDDDSGLVVEPGENATIAVDLTNVGTADGPATVEFVVEDELVEERTVPVPEGGEVRIWFQYHVEEEGDLDAIVSTQHDEDAFTITGAVDDPTPPPPPPPPPSEPNFVLTQLDAPDTVAPGETFTASVDVSNIGEAAGETTLLAEFDGETAEEKTIALGPDESETRQFEFTAGATPGTYTLSVEETETGHETSVDVSVEEPVDVVDFELSDLDAPASVEQDEAFEVSVDVSNVGDDEATTEVIVDLDGVEASESVTLAPGDTETVSMTMTAAVDPGTHTLTVTESETGDELTATITVEEVEPEADFELSNLEAPDDVVTGEEFEVSVDVSNVGEADGTTEVVVELNGVEETETVAVDAGDTETVTVELTADVDPDEYTLTVTETATGDSLETDIDVDDDGIPGFGAIAALVAALAAAGLLARRRG